MKDKTIKLVSFLMIFLLCVNISSYMLMLSNDKKIPIIADQLQSHLKTSDGADPMNLKVGMMTGPYTLEPVDSWDSASNNVIDQVVETLFSYDLEDPDLHPLNQLAESYTWINSTALHVTLRQGILFHDNTSFNAAAAKWNLDRVLFLTNCTGTNYGEVANTRSLWHFPDGITPIISGVSTYGNWDIVINLNAPYSSLLDLLSYTNAGMLSPASTSPTEFIEITGDIVGTGPFRYNYYIPDIEVRFFRWDNYWKVPAFFEEMTFLIFDDYTTAHNAFLAHNIDILNSYYDTNIPVYEADPYITVKEFTEDTGKPGLPYYYMGFNNEKYNVSWRKAFSYAFNYTYIIEELRYGNVIRANSPISPGFGTVYNADATAPNFNLTVARQTLVDMGYGDMSWTDAQWISVAEGPNPFMTVLYTYNLGNSLRENLGYAMTAWLKLIGVAVLDDGVSWSEFINYLFDDHDHLGAFMIGWGPDYLDPHNMLDPMFRPSSTANTAQVNDPWLNAQLALAIETTNKTELLNIYKDIQWYMAEVGFFHAPLYHNKLTFVHLTEIQGIHYNAMVRFYGYPIYRVSPGSFTLTSDAGTPDDDGDFNLIWTPADGAVNYSVYVDSSYITELHGYLTLLADGITDLSLFLSGFPEGSYYFIVSANNQYGYSLSNCINVVVEYFEEHDLAVNLHIPSGIEINDSYLITASVENIGIYNESNVELLLYLDEVLVDSIIIPHLPSGANEFISYLWTPTEYKTYTFKAYAAPVAGEISQDDNTMIEEVSILDTQIFDGLFISYIFDQMGYAFNSTFVYTPYQDGLFYETWNLELMGTYEWMVDPLTRIMSGGSVFGDGYHTPIWIFTDVSIGDTIPIAVDAEGDHLFNVTGELLYDLQGFGTVGVWVVEDLTSPGSVAWYEKSTGILLNGIFLYYEGNYNYTFEFIDTNAQFVYGAIPGPFILSSDADVPDDDGLFTLSWTESEEANSYSVYQHSSFITEITGELTLLADGITDLDLFLEGFSDGFYYFIVVAHNENGDTLSNCIEVVVNIPLPPSLIYDTIPDETTMTYTRTAQIVGSISAYSSSQIIFVGWIGEPDPGFALFTTYTEDENGGIYISETTIMTTNQLGIGEHSLTLRIWNAEGDYYDKTFIVSVYRQALLNLRGEFDYLLKEKVKISIVAQAFDFEDQFILNPIAIEGMTVHIKIADYDGNIKVEDIMTYDPDGFFHWDSIQTIKQLNQIFPKGIYIVQAWIEFPPEAYYLGGIDVIEFHIDPPAEEDIDPWFILGMVGFTGLVGINISLAILLKRKRRNN